MRIVPAMANKGAEITPHRLLVVVEAVSALAILLYLGYHLVILFSPPFLSLLSPSRDMTTSDGAVTITGATEKESHVFVNGSEIAVSEGGSFSAPFILQQGINAIEVRSVNKFGRETDITRRIIKQ